MVVGSRTDRKMIVENNEEPPSFVFDRAEIDIVEGIKCLRNQLNDNLSWDQYTKSFCCKISRPPGPLLQSCLA